MSGFLLGALTVVGVFAAARMIRRGRFGCGGHHRGRGRFDRSGSEGGFMLRWLFGRLETSPGQERVIKEAYQEVEQVFREARVDGRASVSDLAGAMRSDDFDATSIGEAWAKQDGAIERLRLSLSDALQRVHEALEPDQRRAFADLIERRLRGRRLADEGI